MAQQRLPSRIIGALRQDTVGGFLLIGGAVIALIWANSPAGGAYESIRQFTVGPESLHLNLSLEAWVSDALLALFFFIVGNELKEEFVHGELRNPRRAMLPIVAALCGMLVPAAVYAAINLGQGGGALHGWGIPMATDIAFAVAILAVVGRSMPTALRTFLLTLAIADDLGAIVVIAVFYTDHVQLSALGGAALGLGVFGYLQRAKGAAAALHRSAFPNWVVYVPLAAAIWMLVHASGVHATIAGVAMGLLMRTTPHDYETSAPAYRVEYLLRPVSTGIVLPIFALFAAGVRFDGLGAALTDTVAIGIIAGLVGGKLVGIVGGSWLTTKLTRAELNPSLRWIDMVGMSLLAGIGFTVSLLLSELSFAEHPDMLEGAKIGVLIASLLATGLAAAILLPRSAHYAKHGIPNPASRDTPEA